MSKAGQDVKKMQSEDANTHFSNNSETEIEKTSNRKPTGSNEINTKTYKKQKQVPSWRPLKRLVYSLSNQNANRFVTIIEA
jgi:hypothetical protein